MNSIDARVRGLTMRLIGSGVLSSLCGQAHRRFLNCTNPDIPHPYPPPLFAQLGPPWYLELYIATSPCFLVHRTRHALPDVL